MAVVASLEELLLDDPPEEEGDDSALPPLGEPSPPEVHALALEALPTLPAPKAIYAPLLRTLVRGDTGRDVVAVQRALKRIGLRSQPPTGNFGPRMFEQVKTLQRQAGLKPNGKYGQRSHRALCRLDGFDAYGAWLLSHSNALREQVVAAAFFYYHVRDQIGYLQRRPMLSVLRHQVPPHVPSRLDCSEFATLCYLAARADDPNNRSFDGYGNTGTLGENGKAVSLAHARGADLPLYGPAPRFKHTTIAVGSGLCIGMGSWPGPLLQKIDYRPDRAQIRSYLP